MRGESLFILLLSSPNALFKVLEDEGQLCVEAKVVLYLFAGGDDGGVIPAEGLTDVFKGHIRHFAGKVHGNLAGVCNVRGTAGGHEIFHGNAVKLRNNLLYQGYGHLALLAVHYVLQGGFRHLNVHGCAGKARESDYAGKGALQLANVGVYLGGDEREDLFVHNYAFLGRLLLQYGYAGLVVRRLYIGYKAPFKAAAEPVLKGGYLLWRLIR